jgi:Tropomyosin like
VCEREKTPACLRTCQFSACDASASAAQLARLTRRNEEGRNWIASTSGAVSLTRLVLRAPLPSLQVILTTPPSLKQDRIREKLNALRVEADAAIERAEKAESRVKELEHNSLKNEQEIASLQHKLSVAEADLEGAESKLTEHKSLAAEGESSKGAAESLQRKITLLESELDASEKNLRETTEKCVGQRLTRLALSVYVADVLAYCPQTPPCGRQG